MNLKRTLQELLFPIGSTQPIRAGYLKNYRIKVSANTQWAPLFGRWEPAMQRVMVNVIKPGQTVYDLGANFGLHGMLCSKLVGPKGFVYNFEPLPDNIKEIELNYRQNNITNYKNIEKAVSDVSGELTFSVASHATQGKLAGGGAGIRVKTTSLDDFISEGNRTPDFIKMDIEGAEGEALKGFEKGVEKSFPLMIIELHNPEADQKVGEWLKFHKYTAYRFNTFRKLEFEQIRDLTKPYPHEEGIWGSVFCIGPNKSLNDFKFT
jgi:FkbM family methyltransferase